MVAPITLPEDSRDECAPAGVLLCRYKNQTAWLQIIRISNVPCYFLERVVFPGTQYLWQAPPEAKLEVYSIQWITSMLQEVITCAQLT